MILLDTHVLLWLDCEDGNLGAHCREVITAAWQANGVAVSSLSFWEAAMLQQRGRIALAQPPQAWRRDWLNAGLLELPLDGEIAVRATTLAGFHPDPADRFITATAQARGATLISADAAILAWADPLPRLDARR